MASSSGVKITKDITNFVSFKNHGNFEICKCTNTKFLIFSETQSSIQPEKTCHNYGSCRTLWALQTRRRYRFHVPYRELLGHDGLLCSCGFRNRLARFETARENCEDGTKIQWGKCLVCNLVAIKSGFGPV